MTDDATTTPPSDAFAGRLSRVRDLAAGTAVVVTPGSDLAYLVGHRSGSHERLTALVVPPDGPVSLVVPALEAPGLDGDLLEALGVELVPWQDGTDPHALVLARLGGADRVAVSDEASARDVLTLRDAAPSATLTLAGPLLRELRMRKDEHEVAALRRAGAAIDRVHARMGEWLRPGRTEAEVGADIAAAIVQEGHTRADFVIVGSGPHGASPHHEVSGRTIEAGDVVVVDIGGPEPEGYYSDSTRTYSLGAPRDADVEATYGVLQQAQAAAVASVRPGVTAESVDAVAREHIAAAGFGDYFIHRTGHGIGLDVHEEPYVVTGNATVLEPGMAFSVEPGIYLPGRWGARIEDIVVVTADGVEPLNRRPHELTRL